MSRNQILTPLWLVRELALICRNAGLSCSARLDISDTGASYEAASPISEPPSFVLVMTQCGLDGLLTDPIETVQAKLHQMAQAVTPETA